MDKDYKDIHIILNNEQVAIYRAVCSEIKIHKNKIIFIDDNGIEHIENIILLPITRGIKIIID